MNSRIFILMLLVATVFCWQSAGAQDDFEMKVIKTGITRIFIADNLALDISGEYPKGSFPRWENISRNGKGGILMGLAKPDVEDLSTASPKKKSWVNISYQLAQKNGKAVLIADNSYADIDTKGANVILGSTPQTFQLTNFRVKKRSQLTDEALEGSENKMMAGGAEGTVTLSANNKGDVELSFMIQFSRTASRFSPAGLSYRYTLNNAVSINGNNVEEAMEYAKRQQDREESDAALKAAHARQEAEIALKVKNSYAEITKLQATYPSSSACIKPVAATKPEKYVAYYRTSEGLAITYDVYQGSQFKTNYTPVYKTRTVTYTAQKNVCTRTVIIKGLVKHLTYESEAYYEDCSIELKPGEITKNEIIIETDFDAETAESDIRHYYRNNLPAKKPLSQAGTNMAKRMGERALQVDSYTNMTDVILKQGDRVHITADGLVKVGPEKLVQPTTADGVRNYQKPNNLTSFPYGALIAKIGEKGEWFLIGSERRFTALTSGVLILAINDNEPEDNNWHFDVQYSITNK